MRLLYVYTSVAMPPGALEPKIILGETKVYDDGSAACKIPARKPFYFQLIDTNDCVAQTMRSWTVLQPGEDLSCVGCHESKLESSPAFPQPTALKHDITDLDPFWGPARGFSFPKDIQPILDAHCIKGHHEIHEKGLNLKSTPKDTLKRIWTESYVNLLKPADVEVRKERNVGAYVNYHNSEDCAEGLPPYFRGSANSPLISKLRSGHGNVALKQE